MATMTQRTDATINELSSVIGELRNFAAQQVVTNTHIVEELKKISDRMVNFGEVGATFVEYRKTLHERFGKIHEQIGSMDETAEKMELRIKDMELTITAWKANWKLGFAVLYALATISSAIINTYGSSVFRVLVHG